MDFETSSWPRLTPSDAVNYHFHQVTKTCSSANLRIRVVSCHELLGQLHLIPEYGLFKILSRSDGWILSTCHLKTRFATNSFALSLPAFSLVALLLRLCPSLIPNPSLAASRSVAQCKSMRKLAFTANRTGRQGRQGRAGMGGRACRAGRAGRTGRASSLLNNKLCGQIKKRQENAHSGIHTRASRKPTEMSRCSRIRKRIKMLKPLNTNDNGFWRLPNTRSYDSLGYTLHTFKMCSDGIPQERPEVPVRICLESTHTRQRHGEARHVGFCHNSIGVADCLGPWIRRFTKWPGDGAPER